MGSALRSFFVVLEFEELVVSVPPNACRGERCGVWGAHSRYQSVFSIHSKRRGALFSQFMPILLLLHLTYTTVKIEDTAWPAVQLC